MKNIHIIPTPNPSRLFKDDFGKLFYSINIDQEQDHFKPQNIYITSDEKVTQNGIWAKCSFTGDILKNRNGQYACKVILTTDNLLIKDGVQAIDEEFLKWFVKNPSCEEVEVVKRPKGLKEVLRPLEGDRYKIIIPKTTQQIIDEDFSGGLEMGQIIPKEDKIYTEEDVKNAFLDGWQLRDGDLPFPKAKKKWFNEFKNK